MVFKVQVFENETLISVQTTKTWVWENGHVLHMLRLLLCLLYRLFIIFFKWKDKDINSIWTSSLVVIRITQINTFCLLEKWKVTCNRLKDHSLHVFDNYWLKCFEILLKEVKRDLISEENILKLGLEWIFLLALWRWNFPTRQSNNAVLSRLTSLE